MSVSMPICHVVNTFDKCLTGLTGKIKYVIAYKKTDSRGDLLSVFLYAITLKMNIFLHFNLIK